MNLSQLPILWSLLSTSFLIPFFFPPFRFILVLPLIEFGVYWSKTKSTLVQRSVKCDVTNLVKLSHHSPNVLAPAEFPSDWTAAIPSMIVHVCSWFCGGWSWLTFFCKMLLKSDFPVASRIHPSNVAIEKGTGESSRVNKSSTSMSRPDSNATTTLLKRSLSALMTFLLLPTGTDTVYKVSKVFSFCCLMVSWKFAVLWINLFWINSCSFLSPFFSASNKSCFTSSLATSPVVITTKFSVWRKTSYFENWDTNFKTSSSSFFIRVFPRSLWLDPSSSSARMPNIAFVSSDSCALSLYVKHQRSLAESVRVIPTSPPATLPDLLTCSRAWSSGIWLKVEQVSLVTKSPSMNALWTSGALHGNAFISHKKMVTHRK